MKYVGDTDHTVFRTFRWLVKQATEECRNRALHYHAWSSRPAYRRFTVGISVEGDLALEPDRKGPVVHLGNFGSSVKAISAAESRCLGDKPFGCPQGDRVVKRYRKGM